MAQNKSFKEIDHLLLPNSRKNSFMKPFEHSNKVDSSMNFKKRMCKSLINY